jgi:sigma-B regulation protein RsbU (phosphoserine phosphatase)
VPEARTSTGRDPRVAAGVFCLLFAIFLVRAFVDTPGLSLTFLAVFPIVLAGFWLGRTLAVICAAVALVLSIVVPLINPATDISTSAQIVGAIGRGAVFIGLAVVVSTLMDREATLRQQLADAEREMRELESLRAALTSPDLPEVDGLQIATAYTPAEGLVAGDFFLVVRSLDGAAIVVLGDAVGHGLAAARRAAYVRTTIALFAQYTSDPMAILRLANTAVAEREPGTEYVTALCAVFTPGSGTVTWASAGHPAPWDLDRGEPLGRARNCLPLGIEPRLDGEVMTATLAPGGGVLLYTDGLPEARTARDVNRHELFGEDAARDTLLALTGAGPDAIVAGLNAAAVRHAHGAPADDLCLVAVRFDVAAAAQPHAA